MSELKSVIKIYLSSKAVNQIGTISTLLSLNDEWYIFFWVLGVAIVTLP